MNFHLLHLELNFYKSREIIQFADVTYFFGQMGAGKSSIVRLVDFCLGGRLNFTPALQTEFVAATLTVAVGKTDLTIQRERGSNQCAVQWIENGQTLTAVVPARDADGVVIPETEVENLSDLIFHLAGVRPPRVRKSKLRADSDLVRLSFRDLFWYCYLDQDTIDSEFFNLDNPNTFVRLKSRDVMRFIIGFHQEEVAQLESALEELRTRRLAAREAARALERGLKEAEIVSSGDLNARLESVQTEIKLLTTLIEEERSQARTKQAHVVDQLREQGRRISFEVEGLEQAIQSAEQIYRDEQRHLNELRVLGLKIRRNSAARAVLGAVEFAVCPRCAQDLPHREDEHCPVCGQKDVVVESGDEAVEETKARQDIKAREDELEELIDRRKSQVTTLRQRLGAFREEKGRVDAELGNVLKNYDSAYLASALHLERTKAALEQEVQEMNRLRRLYEIVTLQFEQAAKIEVEEKGIREKLTEARERAERDTKNLRRLEALFLDCLVRARIPGFTTSDVVRISPSDFIPVVAEPGMEDTVTSSFANLGSGGKKTLFKACYAIAIHRLAVEVGALLPSLLIIDSAMKNTSERENVEQFEGFHNLLYELIASELSQTQFVIVDKEYLAPPEGHAFSHIVRHMKPGDAVSRPLISYLQVVENQGTTTEVGSESTGHLNDNTFDEPE